MRSTVFCLSSPARTRRSTCSRERHSSTTDSMPARSSSSASVSPPARRRRCRPASSPREHITPPRRAFGPTGAFQGVSLGRSANGFRAGRGRTVSATESELSTSANDEAIRAWDGPLYDRFVRFRETLTTRLGAHGEEALRLHPPRPGSACSTSAAASATRPSRSPRWSARRRGGRRRRGAALHRGRDPRGHARRVSRTRASWSPTSRQTLSARAASTSPSRASARCSSPTRSPPCATCATRSCPAGGSLMVVWRRRIDNAWLYRAQTIVEGIVQRPEEYDEPTCGPGPFSMADADTTSEILAQRRLRATSRCAVATCRSRSAATSTKRSSW